jgi:hypothetical protein
MCQPGADGIALALVIKGDDADLADNFGPDVGAGEVIACERQVPGVRLTAACSGRRGPLSRPIASPASQGHIGLGHGIFPRRDNGTHQPERLSPLLAGEDADHMAPQHFLQDVEHFLGLGDVGAGGEAGRRHVLARLRDRLGAALPHTPQNKVKQIPDITAALLRAGWMTACLIASLERGDCFADHLLRGTGEGG